MSSAGSAGLLRETGGTGIVREELASLKEQIDSISKHEELLAKANGHLQTVNERLIQRLKLETDKRLPFNQAFEASRLEEFFFDARRQTISDERGVEFEVQGQFS